mgnify:CR=1 FL=1|jgi:hypothetical protein|tara:strand:- start:603 stop:1115 length:513 start_codon:yes stop_codon:yes gene_type:complete
MKYFVLFGLISLLYLPSCQSIKESDLISVKVKKVRLRLVGDIAVGSEIIFDDFRISHLLPDTSRREDLLRSNCINVSKVSDNHYAVAPSNAFFPMSPSKWQKCINPRGIILNGWIKCFAYLKNNDGIENFFFDMANYEVYEGYLTIERVDGKEWTLSYSKTIPLQIESLQ